jgi:hypothetical protein
MSSSHSRSQGKPNFSCLSLADRWKGRRWTCSTAGNVARKAPVGALVGRHPGDERNPDPDARADRQESNEVVQDREKGDPGDSLVHLGVHGLDVVEEEIRLLRHGQEGRRRGQAGGVDGPMEVALPTGREDLEEEAPLEEGLAAGEGHAAARLLVIEAVLLDLLKEIGHGDVTPDELPCLGGTRFGAGPRALALLPVRRDTA